MCGFWHLLDWFNQRDRRSGRSQRTRGWVPGHSLERLQTGAPCSRRARPKAPGRTLAWLLDSSPDSCSPCSLNSRCSLIEATPRDPQLPLASRILASSVPFPGGGGGRSLSRPSKPHKVRGQKAYEGCSASRCASAAHQNLARRGQRPQFHPEIPLRALHRA